MERWEYLIEVFSDEEEQEELQERFNDAGENGWEIIAIWPQPGANTKGEHRVLYKKRKA